MMEILSELGSVMPKLYGNVIFNGFAFNNVKSKKDALTNGNEGHVGIHLAHFLPVNQWEPETRTEVTPYYYDNGEVREERRTVETKYIIDKSTGDRYWKEDHSTIRLKCAALFFATLTLQPIALTLNAVNRIAKLVTFAHFWYPSQGEYQFKARLKEFGKDLLIVATTPLIAVGMLLSSVYGATLSPLDGRKLYATFERLAYSGGYQAFSVDGMDGKEPNRCFIAPCLQPEPGHHLCGGEPGAPTAW